MRKTVLILYTSHQAKSHIPFSDVKYQQCYEALYTLGEVSGLHFCRAPLSWYDKRKKMFRKTWEYTHGQWQLSKAVKPDLIFDKTSGTSLQDQVRQDILKQFPVVGDPDFTLFASSKYATSKLFPRHFKPYSKIHNVRELKKFLQQFSEKRFVIKPDTGSGGNGVYIVTKEEALKRKFSYPIIVQEFIDSSLGIPGITKGCHDLRLTFIGNDLTYSYIRTPRPGSLLANLAQGGSMQIVDRKKLPRSIQPIIRDVQETFSHFQNKIYTIDLMFDEKMHPWIVEFNTMPGMYFSPTEKTAMEMVYSRLILELKKSIPGQTPRTQKKLPLIGVVVFDSQHDDFKEPFSKKFLSEAYAKFFALAQDHQVKLYRANRRWYDEKQKLFQQAWELRRGKWKLTPMIRPDVVYDKTITDEQSLGFKRALQKQFPVLNHPSFSHHAGSKLLVSRAFQKYAKPYYSVDTFAHLKKTLIDISGELVVAKPERGNSGQGIFIGKKEHLLKQPLSFPLLIQEFVDSRAGIPGVVKGFHDLRLIYSGDTFIYAYYRTPKKGSFLANVAQGGKQTMVPKSKLPASVWPIVEAVQKYYGQYSEKIYTIDLIFDKDKKPWIVELNTMPGLYPDVSERPHIKKLYLAIILALKKITKT